MRIEKKILGKTDQLKGKAFERLMRILLDYLGYTDFRPDIHYTGMEVDLKGEAKDKVKQESILCEFKAHERPIGSEPLTDFFGKLSFKRSKNPSLKGLFASSSGFTGTALEMIDNDLTPVDRENLRLLNNADIVTLLTEIGLMMSQEKLDERIKNITPLDLGERYIVYLDAGLFIVQLLLVGGKPNHFVILTGKGQLAHRTIESEILELDNTLRSLTRIDLDILEKVTLSLLDMSEKTIKQISGEISETLTDCRVAVDELRFHEGIILDGKETTGSIRINEDIDTLKRLIKKFSESDNKYEFMSSRCIDLVVNDAFIDHVGNRFRLELNNQQKKPNYNL
jgi:hypothetical protein